MVRGTPEPAVRVSVVIPTYNRAAYLREALVSVFNQRLAPSEVIVIDDDSVDDTAAIVQSFAPQVRYVRRMGDRGISAARNRGLIEAQGDLIAWLGFRRFVGARPSGGRRRSLGRRQKPRRRLYRHRPHRLRRQDFAPKQPMDGCTRRISSQLSIEACPIQTSSFVARRRCFEEVGEFDATFNICEDYDMFLRMARRCRIAGISDPSVRYRVHSQNTVKDVAAFCRFRLAVMEKHFGPLVRDVHNWSEKQRRAHGFAFRAAALKNIECGQFEQGWEYLKRGVFIYPPLLGRLDTFYELALGDQPQGHRGASNRLDIAANGVDVLRGLDDLFVCAESAVRAWRGPAYGNAALRWGCSATRRGTGLQPGTTLLQACRYNPKLLSGSFLRRLLKLTLGSSIVRRIQSTTAFSVTRHIGVTRE